MTKTKILAVGIHLKCAERENKSKQSKISIKHSLNLKICLDSYFLCFFLGLKRDRKDDRSTFHLLLLLGRFVSISSICSCLSSTVRLPCLCITASLFPLRPVSESLLLLDPRFLPIPVFPPPFFFRADFLGSLHLLFPPKHIVKQLPLLLPCCSCLVLCRE